MNYKIKKQSNRKIQPQTTQNFIQPHQSNQQFKNSCNLIKTKITQSVIFITDNNPHKFQNRKSETYCNLDQSQKLAGRSTPHLDSLKHSYIFDKQTEAVNKKKTIEKGNLRESTDSKVLFKLSQSIKDPKIFSPKYNNHIMDGKIMKKKQKQQKSPRNKFDKNNNYRHLQFTIDAISARIENVRSQLTKKTSIKLQKKIDKIDMPKRPNHVRVKSCQNQNFGTKIQQSQISEKSNQTIKKIGSMKINKSFKNFRKQWVHQENQNNESIHFISEIIKGFQKRNQRIIDYINTSIKIFTYFIKYPWNHNIKPLNLFKKDYYRDKKTVVFDLDSTLINWNENQNNPYDVKLLIQWVDGQPIFAQIKFRTYLLNMLGRLAKNFEIIIFTTSQPLYVNKILDYIDPKKQIIQHRLFRQHCVKSPNGYFIKDLRILNRSLSETVIVDSSACSYVNQISNAIPIIPFIQGQENSGLQLLTDYIQSLINLQDVRESNEKTFKLENYTKFISSQQLISRLYYSYM